MLFRALALLALLTASPTLSETRMSSTAESPQVSTAKRSIRVVVNRNYAPYSFQTPGGQPQGFLVDQWRAWERKTGVPVQIVALDWDVALKEMQRGRFDVIESIVETPKRKQLYDFLPAYSTVRGSIYFRKDIAGIKDLESLRGFPVGVQAGDQHVDALLRSGVTNLVRFQSNENIIAAAMQRKINVFVLDDPSAHFLLNRLGVTSEFRQTAPVFKDALRRAVRKGDAASFRLVSAGFDMVGSEELERIQRKWVGNPIYDGRHPYMAYAGYVLMALGVLLACLVLWNRTLMKAILQRTAALSESEQRFRQIATSIREVFWMTTASRDELIYVSPAFAVVWGRTGDSLQGAPASFMEAIHEEDRERVRQRIDASDGREFEVSYRIVRPDGSIRWIRDRGFPVRDECGSVYRTTGIAEDVTESKLIDEALRQSEFELAEAQRLAQIGSWSFDVRKDSIRWSEELFRVFDVDQVGFDGTYQAFLERVHPDDRDRVAQVSEQARTSGRGFELEYRVISRSGREKHVREIGYARRSESGEVTTLFGSAQDVTGHKQVEHALRYSGEQLQTLSRRLVELRENERKEMARELHDQVGQNLTALDINLSILAGSLPPEATDMRERLADSGALIESTTAAIRNMLADLRPPLLDEHGLMGALDWHAREFSARVGIPVAIRGLQCTERPAPAVELVLFRVAQEALNNVAKHARASLVEVAFEKSGSTYLLSIRDDGVGFDASDQLSGRHFGLVTMRERSQALGGQLDVETSVGKGTRLKVSIPA
jgi:PAS domain S-box-containing protein